MRDAQLGRRLMAALLVVMLLIGMQAFADTSQGGQTVYSDNWSSGVFTLRGAETNEETITEDDPGEGEAIDAAGEQAAVDHSLGQVIVTFVAGGASSRARLDANTLLPRPVDAPAGDGAGHFIGWYTDDGALFDFARPVAEDITLTAQFGEEYLVQFLDLDGFIVRAEKVPDGAMVVPYPTESLGIPADKQFAYWYDATAGEDADFAFSEPIHANALLIPKIVDALLVIYVSEGTQVLPQLIDTTKPIERPTKAMALPGYKFLHWSKERDGAAYPFTAIEVKPLTLYAVWEKQNVGYTIIYWTEKENLKAPVLPDDYEYACSMRVENTSGDAVLVGANISGTKALADGKIPAANKAYLTTYFEYLTGDQSIEALGDGSAVVNVYFNRKVFDIEFKGYKTNATEIYTIAGGWTDADSLIMSVKLGQNIYEIWPSDIKLINERLPFKLWAAWYSFSKYPYDVFSEALYQKCVVDFKSSMAASYLFQADYVYRMYFLELAEKPAQLIPGEIEEYQGKYYQYAPEYTTSYHQAKTATAYKGWPGNSSTPGFKQANAKQDGDHVIYVAPSPPEVNAIGQNVYYLHYYMDRLTYTLTLDGTGGLVDGNTQIVREDIPHEASLPEDLLSKIPEKTNGTFAGWFYDQGFSEPVHSGDKMPAKNVILYAKYTASGVTVTFYEQEGDTDPIATRITSPGGLVVSPHDYYTVGVEYGTKGLFAGWYFPLEGFRAPFNDSMPIAADLSVYPQWTAVPITVTFHSDGIGSDTYAEAHVSTQANSIASSKGYPPADPERADYAFIGWYTGEDGQGARFTAATKVTSDISVYPAFAAPMTVDAHNIVANTNAALAQGTLLNWHALTNAKALAAVDVSIDTGHSLVTATRSIGFTRKEDYAPGSAHPLTVTARDSLGRVEARTVLLTVEDTTNPEFHSNASARFRVGDPISPESIWSNLGATITDDYADSAFLLGQLTSDYADDDGRNDGPGEYEVTFRTEDTVGNEAYLTVTVLLWDEFVTAEPAAICISEARSFVAADYIYWMEAQAVYYDSEYPEGKPVDILHVDSSAVLPELGEYYVGFSSANATGGNLVTVVPDTYVITPLVVMGKITPAKETVVPFRGSVTFTYTPAPHHMLTNVFVDNDRVTADHPDSYTFTNVNADHKITVVYDKNYTPEPTASPEPTGVPRNGGGTPTTPSQSPVPGSPIGAYDPDNPPESVKDARARLSQPLFTIYDSDVPLAGIAARSMGETDE